MTLTIDKKQLRLDQYDAPVKSDKWLNYWFEKNGKYHIAQVIYASENEARDMANTQLLEIKELLKRGRPVRLYFDDAKTDTMLYADFSHVMQIPTKE